MTTQQDEAFLDGVFLALAHVTRRRIMDVVTASPGCTVAHVAAHFPISRIGVLKHVNVLEAAGLVVSRRVGRDRELTVDPVPLRLVCERWSERYADFWAGRLTRLKYAVEKEKA